jgi:hypothetical protein
MRQLIGAGLIFLLMVTAVTADIPEAGSGRRGTVYWEITPSRQSVHDGSHIVRNSDGAISRIYVDSTLTADSVRALISDSAAAYPGVDVYVKRGTYELSEDSTINISNGTHIWGIAGAEDSTIFSKDGSNSNPAMVVYYEDEANGPFVVGDTLEFATSSDSGKITSFYDGGTTGWIRFSLLNGVSPSAGDTLKTVAGSGGTAGASATFDAVADTVPIFRFLDGTDMGIHNLTIDANMQITPSNILTGINIGGDRDTTIIIENCIFKRAHIAIHASNKPSNNVSALHGAYIRNNVFFLQDVDADEDAHGIRLGGTNGSVGYHVDIRNNNFSGGKAGAGVTGKSYSIFVYGWNSYNPLYIRDNYFNNVLHGDVFDADAQMYINIETQISGGTHSVIDGNFLASTLLANRMIYLSGGRHRVTNNVMYDGKHAIQMNEGTATTIRGNVFDTMKRSPIWIESTDATTIMGNVFTHSGELEGGAPGDESLIKITGDASENKHPEQIVITGNTSFSTNPTRTADYAVYVDENGGIARGIFVANNNWSGADSVFGGPDRVTALAPDRHPLYISDHDGRITEATVFPSITEVELRTVLEDTLAVYPGSKLYLSPGTYTITAGNPLVIPDGVHVYGMNADSTVVINDNTAVADRAVFLFDGVNNSGVHDLTIDGNYLDDGNATQGVLIDPLTPAVNNVEITNCTMINVTHGISVTTGNVYGALIESNKIFPQETDIDDVAYGIHAPLAAILHNATIQNNYFSRSELTVDALGAGAAILMENGSNIQILGNEIDSFRIGQSAYYASISGGYGIDMGTLGLADRVLISNNVFRLVGTTAIRFSGEVGAVTNNVIDFVTGAAINIAGSKKTTVGGNEINWPYLGILVDGTGNNVNVTNNDISPFGSSFVIHDSLSTGIAVWGSMTNVLLDGNSMYAKSTGDYGIYLGGDAGDICIGNYLVNDALNPSVTDLGGPNYPDSILNCEGSPASAAIPDGADSTGVASDTIFVFYDSDDVPTEIHVMDAAKSSQILAWVDTMKTYSGGTMYFHQGIHLVDTTITFGPNGHFIGVSGYDNAGAMEKPTIRLNLNESAGRETLSCFAPDPSFYDSATASNPWTGTKSKGRIDNVKVENLRIDGRFTPSDSIFDTMPLAGIDFRGVNNSQILNNDILNYTWGIVLGANECDSVFYIDDGKWETKSWANRVEGNSIINTWFTDHITNAEWADPTKHYQLYRAAWGPAGIVAVTANALTLVGNSINYVGGPELFIPHQSGAFVAGNNFESASPRDTLNPHVIVGYWDSAPYDSTHPLVNAEEGDCAWYNYMEGGTPVSDFANRGVRAVDMVSNRFEFDVETYQQSFYFGANTKLVRLSDNQFGKGSADTAKYPLISDYGVSNIIEPSNGIAHDGPNIGELNSWAYGDKSLWLALQMKPNAGIIQLQPTRYYVDISDDIPKDYIRVPSNTHVRGIAGETVIYMLTDNDGVMDNFRGIFNLAEDDSNIIIEDIIFDGGSDDSVAVFPTNKHIAIGLASHSINSSIKNVTIRNCVFRNWIKSIHIYSDGDTNTVEDIKIYDNLFIPQHARSTPSAAIWIEMVSPNDSIIGLVIRGNTIIDNGVTNPAYTDDNIYDGVIPINIGRTGIQTMYNTVIHDNIVEVRGGTNVDTVWTEYRFAHSVDRQQIQSTRFYDVTAFKADTMKMTPQLDMGYPVYDIGDSGDIELAEPVGSALDSQNDFHMIYASDKNETSTPWADLLYSKWDWQSRTWEIEDQLVDAFTDFPNTPIFGTNGVPLVIDRNDVPHAFFFGINDAVDTLYHVDKVGGSWSTEKKTFTGSTQKTIAFIKETGWENAVIFTENTVSNVDTVVVLMLDRAGNDNIFVYKGPLDKAISHADWDSIPIDTSFDVIQAPCIASDSLDLHVAFFDKFGADDSSQIFYYKSTDFGETWDAGTVIDTISDYASGAGGAAISVDSNNKVFIAWRDANKGSLYVANNVSGWTTESVTNFYLSEGVPAGISMKHTSQDTLLIAMDIRSSANAEVNYLTIAKRLGINSWIIYPAITNEYMSGIYPSLKIDSYDHWFVTYQEDRNSSWGGDHQNKFVTSYGADFLGEGVYYYDTTISSMVHRNETTSDTLQTLKHITFKETFSKEAASVSDVWLSHEGQDQTGTRHGDQAPWFFAPFDMSCQYLTIATDDSSDIFNLLVYSDATQLMFASVDSVNKFDDGTSDWAIFYTIDFGNGYHSEEILERYRLRWSKGDKVKVKVDAATDAANWPRVDLFFRREFD